MSRRATAYPQERAITCIIWDCHGQPGLSARVDTRLFRTNNDRGICAVFDDCTGVGTAERVPDADGAAGGLYDTSRGGMGFAGREVWPGGDCGAGDSGFECGYGLYRGSE